MTAAFVIPETFVSPEEQMLLFAGACLLGIPCGLVFDGMRLLRRLIPHHPAAVAAEDVLFPIISIILILGYTSAFALGQFRMYYVFGCILGFILYECTLGQIVITVGGAVCRILRAPFGIIGKTFALICKKVHGIFVKNNKKTEKAQKNTQNPLQLTPQMVYNKKRNIKKVKQNAKNKKR